MLFLNCLFFIYLKVQIKVLAAGVNPVDTYIRAGTAGRPPKLPYTPGSLNASIFLKKLKMNNNNSLNRYGLRWHYYKTG
jgi:hypothetical protein